MTTDPGMEVAVSDAEVSATALAKTMPGTFDLIVIDCMHNGHIPPSCRSDTLYASFRKLLGPEGVVHQFTWPNQVVEVHDSMSHHFRPVWTRDGWVTGWA